jgi:hypothetical protein
LDLEAEDPQRQIAHQFVDALGRGNLQDASERLRELESLEKSEIELLADLLSEKASPQIFPWHLTIAGRRPGRRSLDEPSAESHDSFQNFLHAVDCRDSKKAAGILRDIERLNAHQAGTLADLMAKEPKGSSCRNCKLKLTRKRRRGKPPRPLELNARDFVVSLAVKGTAPGRKKAAISLTEERQARLSRSTIYRALKRSSSRSGKWQRIN